MEVGIIKVGDNFFTEDFLHRFGIKKNIEMIIEKDTSVIRDSLKYLRDRCNLVILIFSKDCKNNVFKAFTFTFGLIPQIKNNAVLPRDFEEINKDIYLFKTEKITFFIIDSRVLSNFDYSIIGNILGLKKYFYFKVFNAGRKEIKMITGEREIISDEVESIIVVNEREKKELYYILKQRFPYSFYTDSGESLESVFKKLCNLYHLRIATAESCTAGSLSYTITRISGSSSYFDRGFAVYSNKAKHEILGVSWATLNCFGAVSREVALCMAQGAFRRSKADIAISTTGVAGPTGGTTEKPVGLVYFGLATREKNRVYKKIFTGNRGMIRDKATRFALGMMIEFIKENYER